MIALRGAVTCQNTVDSIGEKSVELLKKLLENNFLTAKDVVAVVFSATSDLDAAYPAAAVRANIQGFDSVPMSCFSEMNVKGGLPSCVRVLLFTDKEIVSPKWAYLDGAANLRSDLH